MKKGTHRIGKSFKKVRTQSKISEEQKENYINADFIIGTTNIVERFFSHAKIILSDRCKGMMPYMLECFLFLKTNRFNWSNYDVAEAIRKNSRSKREADDLEELEAQERDDSLKAEEAAAEAAAAMIDDEDDD